PDDVSLLANDPNDGPYTIIDDERGVFWFEQDRRFKLPRAHVSVLLETPAVNRTPRSRLVAELYVRAIREGLNEWAYLVREAGLGLNLSSERRGISMYVSGYAQRIPALVADVADRLDNVVIDETAFAALKEDLAREYANRHLELAVRQAFYEVSLVLDPHGIHRDDYADLVDEVTLDEVKAFAGTVYDEVRVEGVAYGNLEARALEESTGAMLTALGAKPLADDARPPEPATIQLPSGRTALVRDNGTDNHSWVRWVEFGPRDPRTEAILRLGSTHFSALYYSELRTRQQLGYIVGSQPSLSRDGMGMNYYLQSGGYDATTLGERAEAFLAEAVPTFRDLDEEAFAALQQSVIDTVQQQEESMGDRLGTIDYEAFRLGGDFTWDDKVVAEVKNVTREDVTQAFAAALDEKQGKSFVVFLDAEGAKASKPADPIADKDAFRKGRPTF
ncbi:MAG: insulinase family protein, partial [Myxococcota bacterium]